MRSRPDAMSEKCIVTSSSTQASLIGRNVMESGGNIIDAAIATSAALCVTQNNLCGIGGDLFALIRYDGKIIDFNGSGRSAKAVDADYFRKRNLESIPWRGVHSAFTVPGIVDAWKTIHDRYGTLEFRELLKPAIRLAEHGYPLTHNYLHSVTVTAKHFSEYANWKSIFLPGGNIPEPGFIFRQKDLATSLKEIAEEGPDSYYRGHLADRISKSLEKHESPLDSEDFGRHHTEVKKPLHTSYMGHEIYETGPNSQGPTTLLWLNTLEELEKSDNSSGEEAEFRLLIESGFLAYTKRYMLTDPDFHPLPSSFSSKEFARKIIDSNEAPEHSDGDNHDPGDTTYFTIADSEGNAASVIQSNYMGFGSGIVPEGTGFVMQNRGCYFTLDQDHFNFVMPEKRTFHTICSSMGEKDGELSFSLGTMGGDIQPQIQMQLIMSIVKHGMDPQLALDRPRWAFPQSIYEKPSKIIAEDEIFGTISSYHGLPVRIENVGKWSSGTGHAQAIVVSNNKTLFGGADPRGDGIAVPAGLPV